MNDLFNKIFFKKSNNNALYSIMLFICFLLPQTNIQKECKHARLIAKSDL